MLMEKAQLQAFVMAAAKNLGELGRRVSVREVHMELIEKFGVIGSQITDDDIQRALVSMSDPDAIANSMSSTCTPLPSGWRPKK